MAHYDSFFRKKKTALSTAVQSLFYKRFSTFLKSQLQPGCHRLLEIGGGTGEFARICRDLQFSYKGYEENQRLCAVMQRMGFEVLCTRVPPIPEEDSSFDCATLLNVMEHMPSVDEAELLLGELERVLKDDGLLILIVPSFLDWGHDFYNFDYTHRLPTSEITLRTMLEDCGFIIEKLFYHYGCFFGFAGRCANAFTKMICRLITAILPRSIGRSTRFQKMRLIFAENIVVTARKMPEVQK